MVVADLNRQQVNELYAMRKVPEGAAALRPNKNKNPVILHHPVILER